ncbi:hypothetical protein ACTFIW_005600 [Dictyostelium discoideum]
MTSIIYTPTIIKSSSSTPLATTTTTATTTKLLNGLIFKEIAIYLAHNGDFKSLIEYSLLSKASFKRFQNILSSHYLNRYNFKLTLNQFLEYINNNNNNEEEEESSYKYKLIQYKEIERIKVLKLKEKEDEDCNNEISITTTTNTNTNTITIDNKIKFNKLTNQEIKDILLKYCKQLKKVTILESVEQVSNINYDYSCNGFFKVKRLRMFWGHRNPYSIDEDYYENEYSFNYLTMYKPRKVYIGDNIHFSNYLGKLNKILNCKSIKSIKFQKYYITPWDLIEKSIRFNNLKSLTIRLDIFDDDDDNNNNNNQNQNPLIINNIENKFNNNNNNNYRSNSNSSGNCNGDGDGGASSSRDCGGGINDSIHCTANINNKTICQLITNSLYKGSIQTNTTIKRLIIRGFEDFILKQDRYDKNDLSSLIQVIGLNKSLNTLGLDLFEIINNSNNNNNNNNDNDNNNNNNNNNNNILSSLLDIPNINSLYFTISSLECFLCHCIENSNIKKLYITFSFINDCDDDISQKRYLNIFNTFLTNYHGSGSSSCSLKLIVFENIDNSSKYNNDLNFEFSIFKESFQNLLTTNLILKKFINLKFLSKFE